MLFSSYLPFLSFSHPAGVKNKWIYRQRTSITVAENEKKDRDGIGVFRHMYVHMHRYTRYRSFRPKKNDTSPFRVILRNFHESNRFFSFFPFPFPSLLSPPSFQRSVIKRSRVFRDILGHFSDNSVRREERRGERERSVSPVPLSRRVVSEKRGAKENRLERRGEEEGLTTTLMSGLKAQCLTRYDKSFLVKADIALSSLCDRK